VWSEILTVIKTKNVQTTRKKMKEDKDETNVRRMQEKRCTRLGRDEKGNWK
jgi:hypothetical protein